MAKASAPRQAATDQSPAVSAAASSTAGRRWLLFVHQLPSDASNLRVRTWRRLQQLGARPLKQAVYVLPDSPDAREDFEWLKAEVTASGGDVSVFAADHVDAWADDTMVEDFRRASQDAYTALSTEIEQAMTHVSGTGGKARGKRAPSVRRLLETFRERLSALERVDFFGSAGRDRVVSMLDRLAAHASRETAKAPTRAADSRDTTAYRSQLWITRPRPGVDRMASAWLIRRFIDGEARFAFAADRHTAPPEAVPFDMFDVEFSHHGEHCTFETLCDVFPLTDPAIRRIAAIVHDLDLKDGRFGAPEAGTLGAIVEGLQLAHGDDATLLEAGIALFESLYRSFAHSARSAGPRPVATPRAGRHSKRAEARRRVER